MPPRIRPEMIVANPAGRDERLAQQRQHDMAATENQRARAIERVEQRDAGRALQALQNRQPDQKDKKAVSAVKPTRRDTGMAIWPFAAVGAPRQSQKPKMPPRTIAPICAVDEALNKMINALTTAMDAAPDPDTACAPFPRPRVRRWQQRRA